MEPIAFALIAVLGGLALLLAFTHGRNQRFTKEVPVYRASRLTSGNRLWPRQLAVFPNRVVRYTLQTFGGFEEAIPIDQVASVRVHERLIFGDVIIETTGGARPLRCTGHRKRDAEAIRRTIADALARQPRRAASRKRRMAS